MFVEVLKATGVSENVKQALTAKICGAGGSDFNFPISDSRGNHQLQLEDQDQPKRKKRKKQKNKKSKSPEVSSPD